MQSEQQQNNNKTTTKQQDKDIANYRITYGLHNSMFILGISNFGFQH
jgi:hypothetical protein